MRKRPFTGDADAAWREFGKTEPYYAVLTHEKFKRQNLDPASLKSFFESGERHVAWLLKTIRQQFEPNFQPKRALEFGSGVGRLTIPLARSCEHVVAVDISEDMRIEAERNCASTGVTNVRFVPSDDRLSQVEGRFDLLLSHIVFQHLPPRRTERIVAAMLERLELSGLGCLHFGFAGSASPGRRLLHHCRKVVPMLNNLANWVEGKPFFAPMLQMNRSNLNRLLCILQKAGCHRCHLQLTDHGGELGVIFLFQKGLLPSFDDPSNA